MACASAETIIYYRITLNHYTSEKFLKYLNSNTDPVVKSRLNLSID